MISVAFLVLMLAAALGGGCVLLRLAGFRLRDDDPEKLMIAFVLGFGLIGWCVFFLALAHHIERPVLSALLTALALGTLTQREAFRFSGGSLAAIWQALDRWQRIIVALIAVVCLFDLMEGLAPPADGDSLAYHFALPKGFLRAGGLYPVYQAIEGAIPLMQQMTYLTALGTGGEMTLTLWVMVTGWGATALLYLVARRFVSRTWALALALVFISTPAVLYGGGSGHIEIRNAMFVLAAAVFAVEARRTGDFRYAALAGISAGFFMASKYTGLIFAFVCGLAVIMQRRWFAAGTVYSLALLAAGSQWYGWNAWNTGDPIFPILFGVIPYAPDVPWDADMQTVFRGAIRETVVPANLFWLFGYPIQATLFADPRFESLRVGFGPICLLLAPFSLIAAWKYRARIATHPIATFGAICFLSYAIWFLFGPSQRVRHLLPIYPLLLISLAVAAAKAAEHLPPIRAALILAFAATIPLHMAAVGITGLKYIDFFRSGQDRDRFLERNVSEYQAVVEARKYLRPGDHLLLSSRQLVYYFDGPAFYANPSEQAVVAVHRLAHDPRRLWHQLRKQGITHMLVPFWLSTSSELSNYKRMVLDLSRNACLKPVTEIETSAMASRTLPSLKRRRTKAALLALTPATCRY